ncbi:MAG: 2-polyprenyl-6-methoxyphenol hydroxylase, partial [Roseiflexus sp.]
TLYEGRLDELENRTGVPVVAIHRAALHRILTEALETGTLRFAMLCTDVAQYADSVTVQFANGESDSADLLVAADGIHSVVRKRNAN